jgi:hypothetical protein
LLCRVHPIVRAIRGRFYAQSSTSGCGAGVCVTTRLFAEIGRSTDVTLAASGAGRIVVVEVTDVQSRFDTNRYGPADVSTLFLEVSQTPKGAPAPTRKVLVPGAGAYGYPSCAKWPSETVTFHNNAAHPDVTAANWAWQYAMNVWNTHSQSSFRCQYGGAASDASTRRSDFRRL